MAIDSTLFRGVVPAATYAAGDKISLGVIRGPAVVRDGYGEAVLKRMFSVIDGAAIGHVTVKNSNWIDSMANIVPIPAATILANTSNAVQSGHDAKLYPNSGWEVTFEFDASATISTAFDVFCLIDIDYPSVQAVADPKTAQGEPVTIMRKDSVAISAIGGTLGWTTINVDILKAGFKYLLASATFRGTPTLGFFSIDGAAGQKGLQRIIPVLPNSSANMRYQIDYSTPLVKGPFNINYLEVGTAGTETVTLELDWVKK